MSSKPTSAESFDPYHKWLGIAPKDQPPTYYRLLGIDLFESDPDVIVNATDQRMAHVRSFQTGRNSALSQRILNELAAARLCLLDKQKKARYDAKLRQERRSSVVPPPAGDTSPVPAPVEPVSVMPNLAGEIFDLGLPPVKTSHKRRKSRRPTSIVWEVSLVAVVAAAALVAGMLVLNPLAEKREVARTEPVPKTQKDVEAKITPKPGPQAAPKPPPEIEPKIEPKSEPKAMPRPVLPAPEAKPEPRIQPQPRPKPLPQPEAEAEPQPDTRRAAPDERTQKAALVTIRHVYQQDYKTADSAELAKKLLHKGQETRNDPVARFALFREAKDLAMDANDGPVVFQAIDAMAADYKVNAAEMKELTLEAASKGARIPPEHAAIADAALRVMDAAIADENFPLAKRLGRLALAHARQAKDSSLVQQVVAKTKESDAAAKALVEAQNALAALEKTPHDPAANAVAGKYLCFQKGRWKKGLPMLVAGNDAALKRLAEKDLKPPDAADDRVRLGDEWWQWSDKATGVAKKQLQRRAAYWYGLGAAEATGMVKDKVESRIKEALSVVTPFGVIQPGNLALASNGTSVSGVAAGAEYLLDGNVTNYSDRIHGIACGPCPCEWTVRFHETYVLRQIRFLLLDLDPPRFYRYKLEVSADGQAFSPLVDRSQGDWRGWQEISLPAQPVKAIKLIGLRGSPVKDADKAFQVVELEAYSIIPPAAPGR